MYADDVSFLVCPATGEELALVDVTSKDADGEILEGVLKAESTGKTYPIKNGIPRFVSDFSYNKTWDYKWTEIDRGQGLNYQIADKSNPAYEMHDIFDRNNHESRVYQHATGKVALDLGCGIGQYSWRLLDEFTPEKMISVDLTRGVDIFRKIMLERFPQHKRRLLIIQANVFEMPFRDETFDFVFSLGVLMHTGDTLGAIRQATRVLKNHGHVNLWIYAATSLHNDVQEANREGVYTIFNFLPRQLLYTIAVLEIRLFRLLPHTVSVSIIKAFSSETWHRLCSVPVLKYFTRLIFNGVNHPDFNYRFINNYDGWCNSWADNWDEQEIFPTLKESMIVIRGISSWRLGIWGEKIEGFYN